MVERLNQVFAGQAGGLIARMGGAEETDPARQFDSPLFGLHHALGVVGILLGCVEMDATHGILDVKLKLKVKGYLLRAADNEQVIGHPVGVSRLGTIDTVPGQEFARRLGGIAVSGRPVGALLAIHLEVTLLVLRRLFPTPVQQWL